MTTTTYALHPAPGSAEAPNAVASVLAITSAGSEDDSQFTGASSLFGNLGGVIFNSFTRFDFGNTSAAPVPRSVISSAVVRYRAKAVQTSALSGYVCLLARDGLWDQPTGTIGYGITPSPSAVAGSEREASLKLYTLPGGLGTQIATTGDPSGNAEMSLKGGTPSPEVFRDAIGQSILIPAGTWTMGSATITMNRIGSPAGNVYMELYAANPDGRPTGAVLATSNSRLCTTLTTTGTPAVVFFNFTSFPELTAGARYAVVVRWDSGPSATTYPRVGFRKDTHYADGKMVFGRHCYAFHRNCYVMPNGYPHVVDPTTAALRTSPHRGMYDLVSIPAFNTIGTFYEIDVTKYVQAWVNDTASVGNFIAVHLGFLTSVPFSVNREFDAAELVVTYRPSPGLHSSRLGWVM